MNTPDPGKSIEIPGKPNEIVITRVLHAPRHLVWAAVTDPAQAVQWWGPIGFTTVTEKHDLRVGGMWKHVMIGPDGVRYPNKMMFTEIREPELLIYSHSGSAEGTRGARFEARWTFEAINPWTTRLTLRSVFPTAEDRNYVIERFGALEGGKQTLSLLDEFLAAREPLATVFPVSLQVKRRFNCSAEQVFDAWLDPNQASRWLFATPNGKMQRFEIDARVCGRFVIVEDRAGMTAYHSGEYLEITRPTRLVFSSGVDETLADAGRVQVDIVPVDGGCELTLTQHMIGKFADYKERTEQGWGMILENLAKLL